MENKKETLGQYFTKSEIVSKLLDLLFKKIDVTIQNDDRNLYIILIKFKFIF